MITIYGFALARRFNPLTFSTAKVKKDYDAWRRVSVGGGGGRAGFRGPERGAGKEGWG